MRRRRPHTSGVYAVGFSAGSNCLVRYAGETGRACSVDAAVSVANGFDLQHGVQFIERRAPLLDRCGRRGAEQMVRLRGLAPVRTSFNPAHPLRMITIKLLNIFKNSAPDIAAASPAAVELKDVKKVRTLRQLDHAVTAKLYQLPDVEAYYRDSSCISVIPNVAVPLLCLNAIDDPLIDRNLSRMAVDFAAVNEHVLSVLTSHGGHLGWVSGWRRQWMCGAIAEWLVAVHDALRARDEPFVSRDKRSASEELHEGDAATCAA